MNLMLVEQKEKKREVTKRQLYQLIINQLKHDGFAAVSNAVADATMAPPSATLHDMNRLHKLVQAGIQSEYECSKSLAISEKGQDLDSKRHKEMRDGRIGKDEFITKFITTHREPCTVAKFSSNGKFLASGSEDCSIKLLDVAKMHFHNEAKYEAENYDQVRPVIRTICEHNKVVTDLVFHPYLPRLFSASKDQTIKIFEFANLTQRKPKEQIQETQGVNSIAMHPSGDFLLVGTDHNVLRLYDTKTLQCFTSREVHDHHQLGINQVNFSSDGKLYVSAGKDGVIKVWDGVTGRCVKTMTDVHSHSVSTACFSRNSKYILSSGDDGIAKLWDVVTGRQLKTYEPASSSSGIRPDGKRSVAMFNYDDQLVIGAEKNDVLVWDTQTGEQVQRMPGHNNNVLWITTSPVENSFMSCSEDRRARWWISE